MSNKTKFTIYGAKKEQAARREFDANRRDNAQTILRPEHFYANIAVKIENIRTLVDVFKIQLEPDSQISFGDDINLNLLQQIEDYATAAEDDIAWLLNNYDFAKAADANE
jgi:hypothetical protein